MPTLNVNGTSREFQAEDDTPLLWVLREQLGLTGTKYGCGIAQCGACTVHIDGVATRTCVRPVSSVEATAKIVTIEGLSPDERTSGAEELWLAHRRAAMRLSANRAMIMAAAALLAKTKPDPTDAEIDEVMTNICRCGTYQRIRAGIQHGRGFDEDRGGQSRHVKRLTTGDRPCPRSSAGRPLIFPVASFHRQLRSGGRRRTRHRLAACACHSCDGADRCRSRDAEPVEGQRMGRDPARQRRASSVSRARRWDRGRSPASPSSLSKNSNATGTKVGVEFPTPGQKAMARQRAWGELLAPAAAAASATSERLCSSSGGASARDLMLLQAAADAWKVPASRMRHGQQQRRSLTRPSGRSTSVRECGTRRGRKTRAADRIPRASSSRIRRTWKSRRQVDEAARHRTTSLTGKPGPTAIDVKLPGML